MEDLIAELPLITSKLLAKFLSLGLCDKGSDFLLDISWKPPSRNERTTASPDALPHDLLNTQLIKWILTLQDGQTFSPSLL